MRVVMTHLKLVQVKTDARLLLDLTTHPGKSFDTTSEV
jgi:hypothetical protein